MRRRFALALSLAACLASCATPTTTQQAGSPHESLDALLWMGTSAEHYALAEQAFRLATIQLDQALKPQNAGWTASTEQQDAYENLPAAVVLDIDETVLDTCSFQAQLVKSGGRFDLEDWNRWVREQQAPALPGALEFTKHAVEKGVRLFYVTDREFELEDATRQNLEALGFPVDGDGSNVLSKGEQPDWDYDKTSRRQFIAANHRIVLIFGDDLNDFVAGARTTAGQRVELARQWRSYWGTRWIVIPNPVYGGWEQSLYDFDTDLSRESVLRRKQRPLDEMMPDSR